MDSSKVDGVLIDDDELVRMTWKVAAGTRGMRILAFSSADAFYAEAAAIHFETPIYIDSNLGRQIAGEDVAIDLHKRGYRNLYLATGYEASKFGHLNILRGVIGKNPPW